MSDGKTCGRAVEGYMCAAVPLFWKGSATCCSLQNIRTG